MKKFPWTFVFLICLLFLHTGGLLLPSAQALDARILPFDWTDPTQFVDWYGTPLPNPWLAENHYGVDLTTANRCPVGEGWVLYFKRMTPADQGILTRSTKSVNNISYFTLYNKNTGVLRLFTFVQGDNYNGEDTFTLTMSLVDGSNNVKNPGLFLNDAQITLASNLADKSTTFNADRVTMVEAYYNKWIVIDYLLSYDPTLTTNSWSNLYFKVDIRAHNKMNIHLGGTFEFSVQDVLEGKKSLFNSIVDGVMNIGGQISKRVSSVEDLAEELHDDGMKLVQHDLFDLGFGLVDAARLIRPMTGYVGAALGAFDIISGFTNIGGTSTQTHVMYGKGSITMDGTITDDFPKGFLKMGVSGAQFNEIYDAPKFNGKLGLFSLKRKPVMELHLHTTEVTVLDYWGHPANVFYKQRLGWNPYENFFSIVEVNPETNMQLIQVRIAPVLEVNCDSYTARYDVNTNCFNIKAGSPSTLSYNQMVDPQMFYDLDIRDEWVCGDDMSYHGSSVYPVKAYYKIYMLFQHRTNPNIKMEVMRTYEATIDLMTWLTEETIRE